MCRMLMSYGMEEHQKALLIAFRQLSQTGIVPPGAKPGHRDGWGIIAYDHDTPRYLGRRPTSPLDGPEYDATIEAVSNMRPQILLGHLRKASCGENSIENTQPFLRSQWSFAHNGTIWSPGLIRLGAENDSAAYFRTLLDGVPSSNIEGHLASTLKKIRGDIVSCTDTPGRNYSSLTCLLSDGSSVYAVRDFSKESDSDYYTMYYGVLQTGVVFCQEKIIDISWQELPNKTLATFHPRENVKIISCA